MSTEMSTGMSTGIEHVEIDFMLLADKAEVLGGKLYMMGGAWDRLTINDINAPVALSIVIGVLVPWNLTNESHQLQIRIEDEDGSPHTAQRPIPPSMSGVPSRSTKGQRFRAIAVLSNQWKLPKPGAYSVTASVAGQHEKRVTFYAVAPA